MPSRYPVYEYDDDEPDNPATVDLQIDELFYVDEDQRPCVILGRLDDAVSMYLESEIGLSIVYADFDMNRIHHVMSPSKDLFVSATN